MARLTKRGITRARNREPLLSAGLVVIDHHLSVSDLDFNYLLLMNQHAVETGEDVAGIMHRLTALRQYVREQYQLKKLDKPDCC